ncbi:MAG: hypothetical protein AB7O65_08420 [Candidatus Korobacteraceae bacterium]
MEGRNAGLRAGLLFWIGFGLACTTLLADQGSLSPVIFDARTAWVLNDGATAKHFEQFASALKRWNRLRTVSSRKDADLVIVLSANPRPEKIPGNAFLPEKHSGTLQIRVVHPKSDELLWSAGADSPGKLVSLLKESVKEEEERRKSLRQHVPVAPVGD